MKKLLIAPLLSAISLNVSAELTDQGKCNNLGIHLAQKKNMTLSAALVSSSAERNKGLLDCVLLFKPKPTTIKEKYELNFKNKNYKLLSK